MPAQIEVNFFFFFFVSGSAISIIPDTSLNKYTKIASTLSKVLSKDAPFLWSEEQQLAFDSLTKLLTVPNLYFP